MSQSTGVAWKDRLYMQSSSEIPEVRENAKAILAELGRLEREAARSIQSETPRLKDAPLEELERANSLPDKPNQSPYSLGYNELAERVVELESELAFANKRAENLLASLPVWRCREGQNPELLYGSYWFLKRSAKLTKPAQVGNTVFGVGVKERLVIERAQREHEYQQTPEREAERIARGKAAMEAFQSSSGSGGDVEELIAKMNTMGGICYAYHADLIRAFFRSATTRGKE